jgi:hypothetical protein
VLTDTLFFLYPRHHTNRPQNFSLPWQRKRQYSSSSSGFIIQGRRILTNA